MGIVVTVIHVLACLFLIVVILLQAGRGQGLSWGTMGGSPQSILGTKTASFLTKMTTAVAVLFLFTCIGLNIIETQKYSSLLGPGQGQFGQVDFEKIKQALEEAQQAGGGEVVTEAAGEVVETAAPVAESLAADVADFASPLADEVVN